jgi:hypothetical protein
MKDGLGFLTSESFFIKAAIGVCVGYMLRVLEHIVWSLKESRELNRRESFLYALMILPQSILFGLALGYVLLAAMAYMINNETVLAASAFFITALMAFLAVDIRDLIRRISRW